MITKLKNVFIIRIAWGISCGLISLPKGRSQIEFSRSANTNLQTKRLTAARYYFTRWITTSSRPSDLYFVLFYPHYNIFIIIYSIEKSSDFALRMIYIIINYYIFILLPFWDTLCYVNIVILMYVYPTTTFTCLNHNRGKRSSSGRSYKIL